jgi:periplasmic protein TonB
VPPSVPPPLMPKPSRVATPTAAAVFADTTPPRLAATDHPPGPRPAELAANTLIPVDIFPATSETVPNAGTVEAVSGAGPPATGEPTSIAAGYLFNPKPIYPKEARRRKQQGTVLLEVQVSEEGFPAWVGLKRGSGFATLDEAAIQAVRHWKFSPARLGPARLASRIEVPVEFRLAGSTK